ncbi:MAG: PD-(D/E)XK nuclease family protein [Mycoplasmatota bacterium]|nr:PD-(D/E)XK nuclease family protein [Mycoplasmatota bacterium]
MNEFKDKDLLIVCPNAEKVKILDHISQDKTLYNIKFMTKEEYKHNYYFSYDEKALHYLLTKYDYNLDVAKVYLKNLYVIDTNKIYKSPKLNFLKDLKKELNEKGLLIYNPLFKEYIKNKQLFVKNYYDLEKYEEEMLNTKVEIPPVKLNKEVTECQTLEEEVNTVCLRIISLLNNGVDINKIYLTNISNDYFYTLKKLFSYYKIPLNIDMKNSIYGTKVVKDFLKTKELDLENKSKAIINRKLVNILSQLSTLDEESSAYQKILVDKLKNTYLPPKKKTNAISIKDLYTETFSSDEYVFVLGFNQDILPKMEKDISYINDSIKEEVPLYKTAYLNRRNKETLIYLLSKIDNLYLSYKLSSPFSNFYKSSLITDLNLKVITPATDLLTSSNIYNKLRLAEKLDMYHLYGEIDDMLKTLASSYKIPYNTYSNAFTGIKNDTYLTNLPYPLKLSYTSLNAYNECSFKYYIKYVLKLDKYEDNFAAFIGSMYHKILQLYKKANFNFEEEYRAYLETRTLSLKEKLLLIRIKKDLISLIKQLQQQELLTGFNEALYEKKIDIDLDKPVSVVFTGTIDKIMYYKKVEDTYFSLVDYKTGFIDTHIEPMKYGLHMQLPVYLYLIHYSKVFANPIFTGIFYQNILFNYPTWSPKKTKDEIYKENLMLQGYTTDDTSILARFDSTFEKSEYIKSMSYTEEKGFGTYAKTISNDLLYDLITYTKDHISQKADDILAAKFDINPKVYAGKNIACEFCQFKDLCFMKEKDQLYLEKVDDLSFLGGDK